MADVNLTDWPHLKGWQIWVIFPRTNFKFIHTDCLLWSITGHIQFVCTNWIIYLVNILIFIEAKNEHFCFYNYISFVAGTDFWPCIVFELLEMYMMLMESYCTHLGLLVAVKFPSCFIVCRLMAGYFGYLAFYRGDNIYVVQENKILRADFSILYHLPHWE